MLVKRFPIIFVISLLMAFLPEPLMADRRGFVNTVVIDPGHGGREPGAVGRRSMEKDIALAIALKLGGYISENIPDVKVIYTRDSDVHVPLNKRAQIANENQADLFISIHLNSATNTAARGTETFVMGLHRSQANLEVARRENKSILYEEDYLETYDGFDPNSPEANIIFALYQNAYLDQSLKMASLVQEQFRERVGRIDRGVKQAGFLVLYHVTMPGVLIEAGFISNPREEEYLMSESGQAYIASAIFRAFREYKEEQDALAAARYSLPVAEANGRAANANRSDSLRQQVNQTSTADNTHVKEDMNTADNDNGKVFFKVQIASSSEKRDPGDPVFRGLKNVSWYYHEGLYRYTVGNESSLEAAAKIQQEVQTVGFRDAFVVAFLNEQRISPAEAIRIMNQQENNN